MWYWFTETSYSVNSEPPLLLQKKYPKIVKKLRQPTYVYLLPYIYQVSQQVNAGSRIAQLISLPVRESSCCVLRETRSCYKSDKIFQPSIQGVLRRMTRHNNSQTLCQDVNRTRPSPTISNVKKFQKNTQQVYLDRKFNPARLLF